jgi:hypothetical protein
MKPSIAVLSLMFEVTEAKADALQAQITADMARAQTGDKAAGERASANLDLLDQKIAELGSLERMMLDARAPRPEAT